MTNTFNQIRANDLVIVLKPVMKQVGNGKDASVVWTGEVTVKLLTDLTKMSLNEHDFDSLNRISNLMASAIPAMHENKIVRHIIEYYLEHNSLDLEHMDIVEYEEELTENNVIKLNFDSETEGNA